MEGELEFASVSLRTLYREFMPSVYRMAFSYMQNHPDSEDVVQECFLRLAQSGKHFQDRRQVQAWLIITAANLCKDLLRRSHRRELPLEEASMEAAPQEKDRGVRTAVLALPEKYRTVIYLHYFEGYSVTELAKLLHRPEGTVKTWLRRGRDALRDVLEEEGGVEK
ncbi:MAG: RNA polymerase sigma factor [Oscillospiraceae bacterium]|nr:RNA polymerase sigma factor [Oscillospiraceae bacterium]